MELLVRLGFKKVLTPVPTLDERFADAVEEATTAVDMFSVADRRLSRANDALLAIREELSEKMGNLQRLHDSTTKQYDQNANVRIKLQAFINPN